MHVKLSNSHGNLTCITVALRPKRAIYCLQQQLVQHQQRKKSVHTHSRMDAIFKDRSEEHTSELQSPCNLVCRLLLEKKKKKKKIIKYQKNIYDDNRKS